MRVSGLPLLLASFAIHVPWSYALGQIPTVTTTKPSNGTLLQIAGKGLGAQILVSQEEWWGVLRAAEDLAGDLGKVTGENLTLAYWDGSAASNVSKPHITVPPPPRGPSNGNGNGGVVGDAAVPGGDLGHNATETAAGGGITALYTYRAPTSDINYTLGSVQNFTGPTLLPSNPGSTVLIVGTVSKSPLITYLVNAGLLDTTPINGQWESFMSVIIQNPLPGVDKAMVIVGADVRGTIYGLYDISEQAGVSPWYWWADVPVRTQDGVWALTGQATNVGPGGPASQAPPPPPPGAPSGGLQVLKIQPSPSVRYRGIFLNDEQPALTNWVNANYPKGKYGPGFNHYFHAQVFELLLRLRANYFWPAQWDGMFNVDDYANQPLSDAYGIVMGTSHTEPMMRSTKEWNVFGSQYGGNGQWEYDTNNASIIPFFKYGAQRAAPYLANSLFTMAMRGSGDNAITLTQAEAITVVKNVVAKQRELFGEVFTDRKVEEIPQLWCLYSEVQGYYEAGMTVPDDITLLWADDNFGNVRRLPLANETARSGGSGVYYHVDYVGPPRDYKWINTIQLEKTVEQMQLASARQANRIWMLNVGDLKPLEIPINHFLDLAYSTPTWGYNSVPTWLTLWATREFGSEFAANISSIVDRYGMYAARRKYENIDMTVYSYINYNEADAILEQWGQLATEAQAVYDQLDDAWKPAYYEMILQPVLGGQVVNQIHIGAGKNALYTEQKRNAANEVFQEVVGLFKQDHNLTQRYHNLLGGKWNHMLDQTHLGYDYWQQPMRNALPPMALVQDLETSVAGNIGVGVEGLNATVSGDDNYHTLSSEVLTLPPMDPYGPKTRYIDIFSRGLESCSWTVNASQPYVKLSPSSGLTGGTNGTDTRVYVSIDWASAPAAPNRTTVKIDINSGCEDGQWGNYGPPSVMLPVNNTAVPKNFTNGFVESDRYIAFEAAHTSQSTSVNGTSYITLPGLGRTYAGVTLYPVLAPTQNPATGPVLSYNLYTFTPVSKANITLYLSPSLNQNGKIRTLKYAIAIDDESPQIIQYVPSSASTAIFPTGWNGAVVDGVWGQSSGNTTTTTHTALGKAGSHTLKIWAVEPGVVFQKVIINLGGVRQSYLGPPESFRVGTDVAGEGKTNFAGVDVTSWANGVLGSNK
ncbi:immunoglobulin i-set domain-containing protein [Rutstroemia sp. NJR-2017a WRK4]|nr:immunoglobulin i-set domain-containing protein [Rutstroemia sp. NJR-2017a WRK4]